MFEELYNNKLKNLPVNEISDDVTDAVNEHVSIISSPTGSGETLTMKGKSSTIVNKVICFNFNKKFICNFVKN